MKAKVNYKQIAKISGILLLGLFLGWLLFGKSTGKNANIDEHIKEAHTDAQGNIVYTCSMHPSVRQSAPGNCPICGMELIEAGNSGETEKNPYELSMTPTAMKLADVRTTEVRRGEATKTVHMPGKITVDETRTSSITALFPGRIENLYVDFTGRYVSKGEPLASIYSPELVTAQKELIEASKHKKTNPSLYQAAQRKLKLWELSDQQIEAIEEDGKVQTEIDIVAPKSGYVMERNISREDYVQQGTMMYKIADLSRLWVKFQAYESDMAGLEKGDEVAFTVESAYPGKTFNAHITYINPMLDSTKRTVSVRAEVRNPDNRLKPQMLAEGVVSSTMENGSNQLLIPKSAVLWTGKRSVVYVKKPNTEKPTFEFREVVLGARVGEQYVVKSGLEAGEEVVTNGNFKIDSAAQLAGNASMMNKNPVGTNSGEIEWGDTGMRNKDQPVLEKKAVPGEFKKQLNNLTRRYFKINQALINDELKKAIEEAGIFLQALAAVDMGLISSDKQIQMWITQAKALKTHGRVMQQAATLSSFRKEFALLSDALVKTLSTFGVQQSMFVQYCPMARDGEGAYWVSNQKEIANPYMGQKMLKCGETMEELNPG